MKRYRIGQYSREMGVSTDFIKYYEKNSLLSPQVDPTNKYRYLDFKQSRKIMQILKHRNLGFNSKEIEAILNECDFDRMCGIFADKKEDIRDSIQWYQMLESYLESVEDLIGLRKVEWRVRQVGPSYFLQHTNQADFIENDETRDILQQWVEYLPVVNVNCRVFFDPEMDKQKRHPFYSYGFGLNVSAEHACQLRLSVKPPVQFIPERRCLELIHECDFELETQDVMYHNSSADKRICEIARQNGMSMAGDMFKEFPVNYKENGRQMELQVFRLPI